MLTSPPLEIIPIFDVFSGSINSGFLKPFVALYFCKLYANTSEGSNLSICPRFSGAWIASNKIFSVAKSLGVL